MKFLKNILIPIIFGGIVGFISSINNNYNDFIKPDLMPPNLLFPIVWTILYILMGFSNYIIEENNHNSILYKLQLFVNLLWPILFFNFKLYFISFIWIILLIILVILMIREFYKINKFAAYLQIPYLLWLIFASILSYQVYLIN